MASYTITTVLLQDGLGLIEEHTSINAFNGCIQGKWYTRPGSTTQTDPTGGLSAIAGGGGGGGPVATITTPGLSFQHTLQPITNRVSDNGTIPVDCRSITVFNNTDATIEFNVDDYGSHAVASNGVLSMEVPESSLALTTNWRISTIAGNSGPVRAAGGGPSTIVNFLTRTP